MKPTNNKCSNLAVLFFYLGMSFFINLLQVDPIEAQNYKDPLEPFNRKMYSFNRTIDKMFLKPVSIAYEFTVPYPGRRGIDNFFQNVSEVPNIVNDTLQGSGKKLAIDSARLIINTTLGILGFFDVAAQMGLEKGHEDFGQTLAVWGYNNSTYIVLPIIGPSTVRDGMGLAATQYISPQFYLSSKWRFKYYAANFVHKRSELLAAEKIFQEASVDEYAMVRNAYLQHREFVSYEDGMSPEIENTVDYLGEPPE